MFHQKTRHYLLFNLCSVVIITWLYFSYFFCELSMFFVSFQNRSQFFKSVFWEFHALYLDHICLLPQLLSEPPPHIFLLCLFVFNFTKCNLCFHSWIRDHILIQERKLTVAFQQPSLANSVSTMDGLLCPLSVSMLGFCLAWICC